MFSRGGVTGVVEIDSDEHMLPGEQHAPGAQSLVVAHCRLTDDRPGSSCPKLDAVAK